MTHDQAIDTLRTDMNRLRGRLFSTLEACGLPERQEAAMKTLIRHVTYDCQASIEAMLRQERDS